MPKALQLMVTLASRLGALLALITRRSSLAVALLPLLFSSEALSEEWALGLGADDMFDTHYREEALAALIEYRSDSLFLPPFAEISWLASAQFNTMQDIFLGGGAHVHFELRDGPLFIESSLAAGYFRHSKNAKKQGDGFQYRSSLAVGISLPNKDALSISLDHLMRSDFKNHDPGTETLYLRYIRRF